LQVRPISRYTRICPNKQEVSPLGDTIKPQQVILRFSLYIIPILTFFLDQFSGGRSPDINYGVGSINCRGTLVVCWKRFLLLRREKRLPLNAIARVSMVGFQHRYHRRSAQPVCQLLACRVRRKVPFIMRAIL
jgi:hypothetical protein